MTGHYLTDSSFLLVHYTWQGAQHLFPNAILYSVSDPPSESESDSLKLHYCRSCESTLRQWMSDRTQGTEHD